MIMNDSEKNKIISRIIELESIVTGVYFKGHKAHNQDQYQELRNELKILRKKIGYKWQDLKENKHLRELI